MPALTRLRTPQRIAVAVAGLGLAATVVAPAAVAAPAPRAAAVQTAYKAPHCPVVSKYPCNTGGTKPIPVKVPPKIAKFLGISVGSYVVNVPGKSKTVLAIAKNYKRISWLFR